MNSKERLLLFLESENIKKAEFYRSTGLSNGYLDKNANLSSKNIEKIISCYTNLSPEWLISGTGKMYRDENVHLNVHPNVHLIDKKDHLKENDLLNEAGEGYGRKGNILLVPVKARAGYLAGYGDPEYIEKLEYYSIPGCRHGNYRMFEIEGDSMYPSLKDGDYAIGRAVTDCCQVKSGTIYIIVCREEGIVIKRVLNGHKLKGVIILNSDNEDKQLYPPIVIQGTAILECWELYKVITDPTVQEDPLVGRLNKIEKEWMEFRQSFKKK
jgi:phage repressor protein C with HTH and peptisase S24 domain